MHGKITRIFLVNETLHRRVFCLLFASAALFSCVSSPFSNSEFLLSDMQVFRTVDVFRLDFFFTFSCTRYILCYKYPRVLGYCPLLQILLTISIFMPCSFL